MSDENIGELVIRGFISKLPKDKQDKVNECHDKIMSLIKEYGNEGYIALSLAGLECSKEE